MHDTTISDDPAVSIKHEVKASFGDTKSVTITNINGDSPKTPNDAIENDMWQTAINKPDDMHESMLISKARYESTPESSGSDSIVSTPQDTWPVNEHVKQVPMSFSDASTEENHVDHGTTQPSATAEAMGTYVHLSSNVYRGQARSVSFTGEESMPCDCKYNPDVDDPMAACGDDNACINRMMFMECTENDCSCGRYCLNRRFQLGQYARVDVIKTEKKGYGLRALTDLPTNAFVMEYIGEVISRDEFIRRTKKYENEGLKHHYSMTLNTDEIIDATKKGCLARFINHSCNPNCVTQKWVVGKSMRVGIFTRRPIKAGQEITFDYQFERYGDAQTCFCGEESCKGVIGGMSQGDQESAVPWGEKETVSCRTKKRTAKAAIIRPLEHTDDVRSFVKAMLDSGGNVNLVNKLLDTLQVTIMEKESKDVLKMFVRCHGLKMLKLWLGDWKANDSIIKKILRVLKQLPLANRNGLEDCKFFEVMNRFVDHDDVDIHTLAQELMASWRGLKSVYRIPKRISSDTQSSGAIEKDSDGDVVMVDRKRCSQESNDPCKKRRFDSTRDFFDPDDDMFEYISPNSNASDIQAAIQYPPMTSAIPTEPKAHIVHRQNVGKRHFSPNAQTGFYHAYPSDRRPSMYSPPRRYTSYHERISDRHHPRHLSPPRHATHPRYHSPLPPNWRSARDEYGEIYYYNRITRVTQWHFPEEKTSTIEGVDQVQIDDLVEKAMEHKKHSSLDKKIINSNSSSSKSSIVSKSSKSISKDGGDGEPLSDKQLKLEISGLVKKCLSKQKSLWNDDKELFKELARNLTRHIVECETRHSRKVYKINKHMCIKVEKLIESHGAEFAKQCSSSSSDQNTTSSHTSLTGSSREHTPSWL